MTFIDGLAKVIAKQAIVERERNASIYSAEPWRDPSSDRFDPLRALREDRAMLAERPRLEALRTRLDAAKGHRWYHADPVWRRLRYGHVDTVLTPQHTHHADSPAAADPQAPRRG